MKLLGFLNAKINVSVKNADNSVNNRSYSKKLYQFNFDKTRIKIFQFNVFNWKYLSEIHVEYYFNRRIEIFVRTTSFLNERK